MAATANKKGTKFSFSGAIEENVRSEKLSVPVNKATPVKEEKSKVKVKAEERKVPIAENVVTEEGIRKKPGRKMTTNELRKEVISSYFTKQQLRLIRAAAKSKKVSVSQYLYDLTMVDLEANTDKYERVAKLLDEIDGI